MAKKNNYSMGIAGYVSICVQLYCVGFHCFATCFGLHGHLANSKIITLLLSKSVFYRKAIFNQAIMVLVQVQGFRLTQHWFEYFI
jgi:hypothetical protein